MVKEDQSFGPNESLRNNKLIPLAAAAAVAKSPSAINISAQIAMQQQHGPIPPPEILQKYDQIQQGLANKIIEMANEEATHRRNMESKVLSIQEQDQISYRRSEMVGQFCGVLIALSAIGGSVYEAVHGAQTAASVLCSAGIIGLVTAFILGRQALQKLKEMELKHQHDARQQMTNQQS